MRSTVLETTGLSYTPSGETVELNFTSNITTPSVSRPLVLKGNTGPSTAQDPYPLMGHPFAHIVDLKNYSMQGGQFRDVNDTTAAGGFQLRAGTETRQQYYRSRDLQTKLVDEIGIEITEAPQTGNDDGGPGTFLNFPVGTYYLTGLAPAHKVSGNITYWCNFTKASLISSTSTDRWEHLKITGIQAYTHVTYNNQVNSMISGRFTVTDSSDSYVLLHGCADDRGGTGGFGWDGHSSGENYYIPNAGIIYSELKIWKIG